MMSDKQRELRGGGVGHPGVRTPQQARSQQRVEKILAAAKSLIADKGIAALKMKEIAQSADVTMASIYQYFPNKSAIIEALSEAYLVKSREIVENALTPPPQNLEQLSYIILDFIDTYYHLHLEEPMLRDVWSWFSIDKEIGRLDMVDTRQAAGIIVERCSHLFCQTRFQEAAQAIYLVLAQAGASVIMALNYNDAAESRQAIDVTKRLLLGAYGAGVLPLKAPHSV